MDSSHTISYPQAVAELYRLGQELAGQPRKFDLAHMRVLLESLGSPERRFRSVLIAGTNGKGSTAATLASIVKAAGHRTGLYTSPHILRVNERIRVDGHAISDDEFAALYERVEAAAQSLVAAKALPWHPSFFEMLTAMGFTCFADAGVQLAVLEVGMGGRLDATNVVEPMLSVITDISLDHQKYLGDTIAAIAREKAGIIRPQGTVVLLPQHPEANRVLGETVLERGARAVSAAAYVPPFSPESPASLDAGFRNCYRLDAFGREITVDSPLAGRHQRRNLALAIAAAEQLSTMGLNISPLDIETGIRQTHWPGRLEVRHCASATVPGATRPEIVLDVAHNPAGAWALRAALSQRYGQGDERPLIFVFGAMRDKALAEMAEILFPLARHVIAVRAETPRAASAEEIRAAAPRIFSNIELGAGVQPGLRRACELAGENGVVVVTGSIYIVGEALQALGAGDF